MEILGDRRFVEVPGGQTHELPPLLVRMTPSVRRLDKVMDMANDLIEQEDMMPDTQAVVPEAGARAPQDGSGAESDRSISGFCEALAMGRQHPRMDSSVRNYLRRGLELRILLKAEVWPHAGRSSFVVLLEDKAVPTNGVALEQAMGLRLTFRQPPPLKCFSNQFLFYLNSPSRTRLIRRGPE